MAHSNRFWQRHKFKLNGLVLLLPIWFLYDSLTPEFPPAWPAQQLGQFEIAPMPLDLKQPYAHHDQYVKDFYLSFSQGDIASIRQGYLNIGPVPLPLPELQQDEEGILHGSRHGQHVHAIAPPQLAATDKVWLTLQTWQGEVLTTSWPLPDELVLPQ
ncbi:MULTISPECIES: hypothetical protein [unclassified Arsukibacterium]|uniref:hypothetical protein n=1 Tax=unclassified Arsukibacterium TaxID=2635278 RepID=UPI000C400565|nr:MULTISPECIES: hypothetical protein [unclassified Arsukibacterium]MAA94666.1 hypothetical protein [Rheinheimera sp.]MBM32750.1 hypothetical protein [Rheinheimera sp.]HAW93427.1 hypothetical protein [Candidatus Azambacteria bacterium]|tara:strand:- start:91841 stop:92311 length:471 start_codon:yes stop_codon:yes gene_type:complete